MPLGDWQFWVVTVIAVCGVFALIRVVLPKRKAKKRTTLTIEGRQRKR